MTIREQTFDGTFYHFFCLLLLIWKNGTSVHTIYSGNNWSLTTGITSCPLEILHYRSHSLQSQRFISRTEGTKTKPNQTKQRTFYFGIIIETQEVPKIMKKCPLHSTPFPLGRTFTCKSIIAFAPLDINRRKLCILSAAPLPLLFLYFENTEILFFLTSWGHPESQMFDKKSKPVLHCNSTVWENTKCH